MKNIVTILLTVCWSFNLYAGIYEEAAIDYNVDEHQKHVLEIAKSLPQVGVLKMKSNGYVYLDISNEYITKIFPNMILDGHLRPTASFGSEEGAHITVAKDTENSKEMEKEVGREFSFKVVELRKVGSYKTAHPMGIPITAHTGDRWMIAVESPELEQLRMQYNLTPLVDHHDFHISIGFEVPFNRINNFGEHPPAK